MCHIDRYFSLSYLGSHLLDLGCFCHISVVRSSSTPFAICIQTGGLSAGLRLNGDAEGSHEQGFVFV